MDSRTQPEVDRVYEDFEPFYEWTREDRLFTVLLPGYRRDQLKVQVTSKPALRLIGERLIRENRWRRFNLEFPIPADYDTDKVTAKFEGGSLSVKFGELIKPRETTPQEASLPKEPSQKVGQEKDTPKEKEDKRTNGEGSDQKIPQKEEPVNEMEKSKTETADSTGKGAQEDRTNGLTETKEAATSKVPKTKDAKFVSRSKTRLIDFTHSFGPSNQASEAVGDSGVGLNKLKKWVKWVVLISFVVGLGLYARNAFRSSREESNSQELIRSLIPYLLNR